MSNSSLDTHVDRLGNVIEYQDKMKRGCPFKYFYFVDMLYVLLAYAKGVNALQKTRLTSSNHCCSSGLFLTHDLRSARRGNRSFYLRAIPPFRIIISSSNRASMASSSITGEIIRST